MIQILTKTTYPSHFITLPKILPFSFLIYLYLYYVWKHINPNLLDDFRKKSCICLFHVIELSVIFNILKSVQNPFSIFNKWLDFTYKKINLDLCLSLCKHFNSNWITNLNVINKTIKFLEESMKYILMTLHWAIKTQKIKENYREIEFHQNF